MEEPLMLKEGETIALTTPNAPISTVVYITVFNGKLRIQGGSSIIESISGDGMAEKIKS